MKKKETMKKVKKVQVQVKIKAKIKEMEALKVTLKSLTWFPRVVLTLINTSMREPRDVNYVKIIAWHVKINGMFVQNVK